MRFLPKLRIFKLSIPAKLLIFSMLLVDSARCLWCARVVRWVVTKVGLIMRVM